MSPPVVVIAVAVVMLVSLSDRGEAQIARPSPMTPRVSHVSIQRPQARGDQRDTIRQHSRTGSLSVAAMKQATWKSAQRHRRPSNRHRVGFLPHAGNRFTQQERLLESWAIRVIDGDTFAYGNQRIRIQGIDTPEVSEAGGFEATQRLDSLLREGVVTIAPKAVDKYNRTVAEVYVDHRNVARTMTFEGYAKQP